MHAASSRIAARNDATLAEVQRFRSRLRAGETSPREMQTLKHEHPFHGLQPCRAAETDFVLFTANDDVIAWEYLWGGDDSYEPELVATWVDWCRESTVVYDVGGYSGLMSILAALVNPAAEVHLFEPMDRTVERAQINMRCNGVDDRVRLHTVALSDTQGYAKINLYRPENFLGTGNSLLNKDHKPVVRRKRIRTVMLDRYLPNRLPDLVKIDVEGHELAALHGMAGRMQAARPRLMLEAWEETRVEVLALLESWGYTCVPVEAEEERVMNFLCTPENRS